MRRLAALSLMLGLTLAVGSSRPTALAQAPRGVAGPRGLPGPVGITWRGAYSPATAYNPRDVVSYSGSAWICTGQTTGDTPPGTHWQTLAQGGAPTGLTWRGAYSSSATYQVGDGVSYNGSTYVCVTAGTGNLPTGSAWNLLASKGDAGPPGATGPAGAAGANGATGAQGPPGANGTSGSTWRNGSGTPSNGLGTDGDYFLDVILGDVYQRATGTYSKVGNIKGPPGSGGGFTDTSYADLRTPAFGANINGTSNENALQAAHDALLSTTPGGTLDGGPNSSQGIVNLPPGTWLTSKPVWWDGDQIALVGRSDRTSIVQSLTGAPPVMVGFKRRTAWNRSLKGLLTLSGTLTFTSGSTTVAGAGTNFAAVLGPFASYPRYVTADLVTWYAVQSVNSDTSITLTAPYAGATFTTLDGLNKGGIGYLETIPKIFAADHRMDIWNGGAPKLDSSLVTGVGQRYGITAQSPTSGSPWPDHAVSWFACPGPTGNEDCWEDTQQFTLDVAIEAKDGGKIQPCYITGMGSDSQPNPWVLQTGDLLGGTSYSFYFLTKEGVRDSSNSPRRFYFGNPSTASGVQRISIQIDLVTPAVRAWIGQAGGAMTEQFVTMGYGMSNPSPAPLTEPAFTPGLHFQSNEPGEPLNLFGNSPGSTGFGANTSLAQRGSFRVYGYRMTSGLRYASDGSNHQILAGGVSGTLNDDFRFNDAQDTARSFFCLDTSVAPTADYNGKLVTIRGGPIRQTYYGYFISPFTESISAVTTYTRFRDLRLNSGSHGSNGLLVGPTLHMDVEHCMMQGWHGIGSTGGMGTYDININECEFIAPCSWIFGSSWNVRVMHPRRSDIGRWAMIFDGSNSVVDGVLTSNSAGNNRGLIKILGNSAYGYRTILRSINCDNEGTSGQFQAAIYAERTQSGAYLEIDDLAPGTVPPGTVVIDLVDRYAGPPSILAGVCKIRNVLANNMPAVRTSGPGWEGTIEDCDWSSSSEWVRHTGTDGQSNVVANIRMDTLPRSGVWQANAATVAIRHPTVGAPRSYICTQSGTATYSGTVRYSQGQVVNYQGTNYTYASLAPSTGSAPGGGNPNWTTGAAGPTAMWAPTSSLGTPVP
jgi:hypothetical protein